MKVLRFDNPTEFTEAATPLLLEGEAENNLILGLSARIEKPSEALFCLVRDGDRTVGAALQTDPPHNLLLSHMSDDAAVALADALSRETLRLPGVQGIAPSVQSFAARWLQSHDLTIRSGMCLGIYRLTRVIHPRQVAGEMCLAQADDLPTVAQWMREFHEVVGEHRSGSDFAEIARTRINAGEIQVWRHEGNAVCIAAATGATPNGIRIGLVYTPPHLRKRGYASALVAALSQKLLDSGRRFCFLFTDLANPTSNKIYREIGYEFVCEQHQLRFQRD